MTIGEKIKQRRKELGISINQLSQRLGKNRATIYRYENNEIENIPMTILKPLSEILQTTPEFLCGISSDELLTKKKASPDTEEDLFQIQNLDLRRLVIASQNMTDQQIELIRKYAEFMFPDAFV